MDYLKISTWIALVFVISLYLLDFLSIGMWPLTERIYWSIGGVALLTHYFWLLSLMWRNGRWGWFFSAILLFFAPTFIYYFFEHTNETTHT